MAEGIRGGKGEPLRDLDIRGIMQYHNCKYPCLMIDHCEEIIPGKYARAVKNFTYNEWFFPGHFEDDPNVPSSIQLEAMSQTLLMTFLTIPGYEKAKTACLKINNVEFKRKIIPGDRLVLTAELRTFRGGVAVGTVEGHVGGQLACRSDYVMGIPAEIQRYSPGNIGNKE